MGRKKIYKPESRTEQNKKKYLASPTHKQVIEFVKEFGVSCAQFERFWGWPEGVIKKIPFKGLPAKYWHVIYEKIKPAYGIGYASKHMAKSVIKKPTKQKKIATTNQQSHTNELLLERLNKQLN